MHYLPHGYILSVIFVFRRRNTGGIALKSRNIDFFTIKDYNKKQYIHPAAGGRISAGEKAMELEKTVAANLTELRKSRQWTQLDLAEKISYSDKTVSKWERGEGLPDLKTICQLAELFGVTVDYFVTEDAAADREKFNAPKSEKGYHICISLLAVLGMWIALTVGYVYTLSYLGNNCWTLFIWGVPASFLILEVLGRRFLKKEMRAFELPVMSLLCWTLLAAIYLQFLEYNIWPIFFVGIPVQAAILLLGYVNRRYRY